jgi:RNA polymerase sigma factor (TIGR02999 family)
MGRKFAILAAMGEGKSETTQLLLAWGRGEEAALDRLTPHVYAELRRIAGGLMQNERVERTIQPTALVHEAYLRLIDVNNVASKSRAQFFALAAQVMRRLLLEGARKRAAEKRGGKWIRVDFGLLQDQSKDHDGDLIALEDALQSLAGIDARKASIVELRFFGGLSVDETAEALGISVRTVHTDWALARAWLFRTLSATDAH